MKKKYTETLTEHFRTKSSRLQNFLAKQGLRFYSDGKFYLIMLFFAALFAPRTAHAQATITTDKSDYHPWDHVIVTGASWQPGEQVELFFEEYPVIHDPETIVTTADASGNVYNADYLIELHDQGQSFTLTATGMSSGMVAKAFFTDGPPLDLDQGQNGAVGGAPVSPVNWVNGNSNKNNSHFLEGQSIPYRFILKDVTVGTHTVIIGWDNRVGGKSALDYITHYQRISEVVSPTVGLAGSWGDLNLFPIPAPTATVMINAYHGNQPEPLYSFNQLPSSERLMSIYNGNISSIVYDPEGSPTATDAETRLKIIFTVSGATKDVLFAWGGHIASRLDWGAANAASDINGSPYHTRVVDFDGKGGSQDRSLKTDAVLFIPQCSVIGPQAVCPGSTNSYTAITDGPTPTYTWSAIGGTITGSNTGSVVSVVAPASGAYTVNVRIVDMSGGAASASSTCGITASVTAAPTASAGPDQSKCYQSANTSFTLAGGASNGTATWSVIAGSAVIADAGNMNSSVTVSSGSATLQLITAASNSNCANASDNVILTVNPLPTVSCGPGGTLTCTSPTLALGGSVSAGASVIWSGPGIVSGESSVNPVVNQAGTYKMVATFTATGCSDSCSVVIGIDNDNIGLSCGVGGTLTCAADQMTLSATTNTGITVAWSGPGIVSGGATLNPVINAPGDYKIVATKSSNGCKDSCVVHVDQDISRSGLSCGVGGTLTCAVQSLTLSATTGTGVTVVWSGPGIVSGGTSLNPEVNMAGDYKIIATKTSSGCKDSCVVHVSQDIAGPQLSCGGGATLTCVTTTLHISASTATGVAVVWSGPGIVGGETTLNPIVNEPGTYKIVATKTSSGCKDSCTVVVAEDVAGPQLVCGAGADITCANTTRTLSATTGTDVTVKWSGPGIVSGETTLNPVVNMGGDYKVVATEGSSGCKDSCVVTVRTNTLAPSCSISAPDPLPQCASSSNSLSAHVENAATFVWSVVGSGWAITGGQGTENIQYTAGAGDSATFKLVLTGENGCMDSCIIRFGTQPCQPLEEYCSLTQGFYGNGKGVACATGERGGALINRLLGSPYGNLVIGKAGRSLTITQATAYCIIARLPAGGTPTLLPVGDEVFGSNCSTLIQLNRHGRFNNVLLGQTITLGLNMRLDGDLGALALQGTEFTTIGSFPGDDGQCGTEDDVKNFSSVVTKTIPQAVLDALNDLYGSATVAYLFDLANRALGGQSTGGATLSQINEAVSSINEGFDGCRFLQGWDEFRARLAGNTENTRMAKASDLEMKAYPNPFEYSTTIEFSSKKDGAVSVNVYSLDGKKVASLYTGEIKSNEVRKVVFNGEDLPSGVYFYKITMGDTVYFDKLMLNK